MRRIFFGLILSALSLSAHAADTCLSSRSSNLDKLLNFENPTTDGLPGGWTGGPPQTSSADDQVAHGSHASVRIERGPQSSGGYSNLLACLKMDFAGSSIELRGFLRTAGVAGVAGLWLRQDGDDGPLAIDTMSGKRLKGTTDWTEYSVSLPREPDGREILFGAYLAGTGKVWVADLQVLVDGRPVWTAPGAELTDTPLTTDHEFDKGSGIVISSLSDTQITNLAILGKVWGFLKYYHPEVRAGHRQWDFDLFRVMPAVMATQDRNGADAVLLHWIKGLGPVAHCAPCHAPDQSQMQLRPDLAWIDDEAMLGKELSQSLRWIRDNAQGQEQFYVGPGAYNPTFAHELHYRGFDFPDAGFQLLALYRYWNIIEYWYPYRDIVGEDWDQVLRDFIPRLALAKDRDGYLLQMMMLIAQIHDSHAKLRTIQAIQPPAGDCDVPAHLRFVEGQPMVTGYLEDGMGADSSLKTGDVLIALDGIPVGQLVERWAPYYGASNRAALLRDIAFYMLRGTCGPVDVDVQRDGISLHLQAKRTLTDMHDPRRFSPRHDDLPGPAFRLLSPQVGYLKVSSIKADQIADYIRQAAGTKGLVIDMRGYPSESVAFPLGSLLVDHETPFARHTMGDPAEPGAFLWNDPLSIAPAQPHYGGKVIVLVDQESQSQSEYTSMIFRSAPETLVVGSTTAGADGSVSTVILPGDVSTDISGIGVFYPDKKPTQRVGIVPDVTVEPTIAGIRAGKDEVLEKALRLILGPDVSDSQIKKMYATGP